MLRYRIHLEQRKYAPATINLRLAAVRRIAYEAADAGLLSPELAAGIRRVKGVRRIGVRLGNWLTPEQGRRLLESATPSTARELRDHAMVAMLIGCGLQKLRIAVNDRLGIEPGAAEPDRPPGRSAASIRPGRIDSGPISFKGAPASSSGTGNDAGTCPGQLRGLLPM